ncbi:MAG: PhzF family phenazine biosynthesis protein [Thermoanaerobaculia bacterium]
MSAEERESVGDETAPSADRSLRFVLVDVFADRPLAGNPLAVFPRAEGVTDARMQRIAREMDHAATAFLAPASIREAAFRLRIFSREREIPFAGHPALGAHYVHATESGTALPEGITRLAHEGAEGLFEVEARVRGGSIDLLRLTQRLPEFGPRLPDEEVVELAAALRLQEKDIQATNQPVKIASTGLPTLIVPVSTLAALENVRPRYDLLRRLLDGRDATLVYAFSKETQDARAAAHARAFDTVGSVEVPGAGAAAGALAAYLVAHSAVTIHPLTAMTIEQGHGINRPSTLFAEIQMSGPKINRVVVGGRVIRVGEGVLEM